MGETSEEAPRTAKHILVVDDEETVCRMLSAALSAEGYQVTVARNGREALRHLSIQPYDLIISDIRMPGMDGLALLKETKKVSPEPLVVIMTGYTEIAYVLDALRNGAAGFLVKPFSIDDLRFTIGTAFLRRETQDEVVRLKTLARVSEITRELVRTLDIKPLAELVVDVAAMEAKANRASLMLSDRDGAVLTIVAARGLPADVVTSTCLPLGEGIAGHVAQSGNPLVINSGEELEPWLRERLHLRHIGPAASVPLISLPMVSEGKPLGVLNLSRPNGAAHFTDSDVNLLSILADQATIAIRNAQLFQQVRELYLGAIQAVALTVQAKDAYTHGHSDRVAEYTVSLAHALGLPSEEEEDLRVAALLHDIGKIGVREEVLNKPGPLTPEEFAHVKQHTLIAERILRPITELGDIVDIIKHEHEYWDGNGYPSGIRGGEIPLGSRIIAVVDAFHAMTSDRPYRRAMSVAKALDILRQGAGKQWDARIVNAWLEIVDHVLNDGVIAG